MGDTFMVSQEMLADFWQFSRKNWHVLVTLILVLMLPFGMNQLEARENLRDRIAERLVDAKQASPEVPAVIACLQKAEGIVIAQINAGVHGGDVDLRTVRQKLDDGCVDSSFRASERLTFKLLIPNTWPSSVLVFFVVSVCSIIGYAATTLRGAAGEVRDQFEPSRAVLAAVLAFGFLLALRSGYTLAFTPTDTNEGLNVFGLAFIGFLVGLFTEQAFSWLSRTFERFTDPPLPDPPDKPQ
ncbi:MAG: hypothetical protein AAFR65_04120 [Pseudomonadota bacterium]